MILIKAHFVGRFANFFVDENVVSAEFHGVSFAVIRKRGGCRRSVVMIFNVRRNAVFDYGNAADRLPRSPVGKREIDIVLAEPVEHVLRSVGRIPRAFDRIFVTHIEVVHEHARFGVITGHKKKG